MSGLLVALIEEASGEDVLEELRARAQRHDAEVRVVAPAVTETALEHTMGDVDAAIPAARERLERTLRALSEDGLTVKGEVGDSDPILAISDELQTFDADEIVIVGHSSPEAAQEKGVLERARSDFPQPVTELFVNSNGGQRLVDAKRTPAGRKKEGRRFAGNLPPLSARDVAGIVVGVVGTLALVILAANCGSADHEELVPGGCGLRMLIALAAALINFAHAVGLILFQSVSYSGNWERLFARLSLFGTPIAVVVSLLIV